MNKRCVFCERQLSGDTFTAQPFTTLECCSHCYNKWVKPSHNQDNDNVMDIEEYKKIVIRKYNLLPYVFINCDTYDEIGRTILKNNLRVMGGGL